MVGQLVDAMVDLKADLWVAHSADLRVAQRVCRTVARLVVLRVGSTAGQLDSPMVVRWDGQMVGQLVDATVDVKDDPWVAHSAGQMADQMAMHSADQWVVLRACRTVAHSVVLRVGSTAGQLDSPMVVRWDGQMVGQLVDAMVGLNDKYGQSCHWSLVILQILNNQNFDTYNKYFAGSAAKVKKSSYSC